MSLPRPGLKGFEKLAATVKPDPTKRLTISDPDTRGLYLRVMPSGTKSWMVVARNDEGKQVWARVGDYDLMDLHEARTLAKEGVKRIKRGEAAFAKPEPKKAPDTFRTVYNKFAVRYVDKKELRSAAEIKRVFETYVLPQWGERPFKDIRRNDVANLLDDVEDGKLPKQRKGGSVMADRVLAALSKLFAWHATRDDTYSSPIAPGMRRSNGRERARTRTLSDDEIRLLWGAAEQHGSFGRFLQICLLTAQRRAKVMTMRWQDIDADGVWTMPSEAREKANAGALKLPPLALAIIKAQPKIDGNDYVFAGRGKKPMDPGDKLKKDFDAKLAQANGGEPLPAWTIHDLRRTAKSLMSRAGVRPDISERVLGHVIAGVEGVYDRHSYLDEKGHALAELAALIERIINPPSGNVVELKAAGQ